MSFGLSLGDIALVSTYAYNVYKSCQGAGEAFASITTDVRSLKSLLSTLDDESTNPRSSLQRLTPAQQGELKACLDECKGGLREVDKVLRQYRSLDTKSPRFRDQLAFTTGKQTALRERMRSHSERIQQFLTGINVTTFSRIERNTEAQIVSLLEIEARLNQMHRDLLSGRRNPSMLEGAAASTDLEKEILRDDATEVDIDISDIVSHWLDQVRHEHKSGMTPSPYNATTTPDYDPSIKPCSSTNGLFKNEITADLPSIQSLSISPTGPIVPENYERHESATTTQPTTNANHVIDLTSLKPQRVAAPRRQAGYDYARKKHGTPSNYSTTLEQYVQAIIIPIKILQEELREGAIRVFELKRNVFKKSASHEEVNFVTVEVEPQKKRDYYIVLFKCMGNRTMRDSRGFVRGAEVLVEAEHVLFRFHCS
ncbi:hypothetical protein CC86DRAFT_467637 [Ophiobolus disseminans]|uniref:Fungal N-terminal domain-containing protein n=1 Tax=Ophiobolus disseminans TaxID=1469910 RepID=A0A6A6ZWK0_9PLEO|nr:hypothetical protein CC86DRAFT_467637 [Ophiobolus disseminans]